MSINVAVIGVGGMGRNHCRVYNELKDVNLVAVSDINQKKVNEIAREYECNGYTNYMEMLKKEKIDAISICVPTRLHFKVTSDILKKYKPAILIEKPMTYNIEEAKKIINLAERKNVFLTVGHIERYNPAVQKVAEIIRNGILGRIFTISSKRVGLAPKRKIDCGVIMDLGVHDIDVMRYISRQEVKEVFCNAKRIFTQFEDCAFLQMKFKNDILGIIEVNWLTPTKIRELFITGEMGVLVVDYISQDIFFYEKQVDVGAKNFKDFICKYEVVAKKILVKKEEPLKLELENFVNSVNKLENPLVSAIDGLITVAIANYALKSNKNKKIVSVIV
ncbi:MAG: Gfo/Idh/MocA family oxidoreductase [Candidatus Parvarchaeota archaeon]|nr:Gfo/Idh/MocA family oxidoreductase [Candidatus Jingweiarchaeum tengchongense]MCW1310747.1 Gfo/Idh/MocA family oxidoreductase [Candidatus Jingweiarchaeum tengchongense]